jgi:hypothetical protein
MKVCSKCNIEKTFSEFNKDKTKQDGFRTICKKCRVASSASYYSENTGTIRQKVKEYWLRSRYGMEMKDLEALLASQGYCCPICKEKIKNSYHIDHNHDTGEVRGLLCGCCNRGLGIFKDSPSRIQNAFQYLIDRGYYGP